MQYLTPFTIEMGSNYQIDVSIKKSINNIMEKLKEIGNISNTAIEDKTKN